MMSDIKPSSFACAVETEKGNKQVIKAAKIAPPKTSILHNNLPYGGCILSARQLGGGRTLMADALTAICLPECNCTLLMSPKSNQGAT